MKNWNILFDTYQIIFRRVDDIHAGCFLSHCQNENEKNEMEMVFYMA
jgi:hypothetical protein